MAEAVVSMYTDGRVSFTHAMPELMAETVFSMSIDGSKKCIRESIMVLHICNKLEHCFLYSI